MARRSGGGSGDLAVKMIISAQDLASKVLARVQASTKGLGDSLNGLSEVSQKITFVGLAFGQVQAAIAGAQSALRGFYDAFIGSNIELEQQLLQTRASLAATIDIFQDGVRIEDVGAQLEALAGPLERSLDNVRAKSLNLVGITSDELIPLYQILAQESGAIGASFEDVEDLTISFGAALSTLQLPVSDFGAVRQEVASILQGTVSVDSTLATSLGISNSMVESWRSQGTLVQELNRRLEPFVEANAQAAATVPGLLSNVSEIFQTITREAGKGLDQLIAEDLNRVYEFLTANADRLQEALTTAIRIVVDGTAPLRQSFRDLAAAGVELGQALLNGAGGDLQQFATNIVQTLNSAATVAVRATTSIVGAISNIANSDAGKAAIAVFIDLAGVISNVTRGAFELFGRLVDGAVAGLKPLGDGINQAIGFLQQFEPAVTVAREVLGLFVDVAGAGLQRLPQLFALVNEAIRPFVETIAGPLIGGFRLLQEIVPPILGAIANTVQQTFQGVVGVLERFAETVGNARQLLRDLGILQEDLKPATQGTADVLGEAADAFGQLGSAAADSADGFSTAQKAVDALQQEVGRASKEIERSKLSVDVDQSQQLAALQQQLNDGLISERDFQNQRQQITEQGLEQQLAIVSEKANELRAQYDALSEVEQQQATESLDQILKLEQEQAQLQQQLGEQQIQNEKTLRDQARQDLENSQKAANDAITAAATQREIELQELRNAGLLSEREQQNELTKINADRIDQTLAQEQQRLAELRELRAGIADDESQEAIAAEAEIRASEQRVLGLTKERLESELALQQQAQEEIIRAIDKRAQAAQNAATREQQAIEGQLRLYDSLNSALEQQANLLEAQNGLRQAESNLLATNFDIAASLTRNERDAARLKSQGAAEQLRALREQQAFEDQSLLIQQELERLALARRQTEAEIAEIQARAAIAQAEAERARTQAAFERGDASAEEVEAANLSVQAANAQLEAAQQQQGLIAREAAILPEQQAIARQRQDFEQQSKLNQARAAVIQSLPENSAQRRRAERAERDRLLTEEQQRTGRSQRATNNLVADSLRAEDNAFRQTAASDLAPQLAAPLGELAPVQRAGNEILSRIEQGITRLVQGGTGAQISAPFTIEVNGAGGQVDARAIASTVRNVVEQILDRAGAIQQT